MCFSVNVEILRFTNALKGSSHYLLALLQMHFCYCFVLVLGFIQYCFYYLAFFPRALSVIHSLRRRLTIQIVGTVHTNLITQSQ